MKNAETVHEAAQVLDLLDEDLRLRVLNMLKGLKKTRRTMSQHIENISKEIGI